MSVLSEESHWRTLEGDGKASGVSPLRLLAASVEDLVTVDRGGDCSLIRLRKACQFGARAAENFRTKVFHGAEHVEPGQVCACLDCGLCRHLAGVPAMHE